MKRSLSWHRECLANMMAHREKLRAEADSAQMRLRIATTDISELRNQIERAEREGRVEFDREKFNKKRSS